jgi:hypothetical protein
MGVQKPSSKVAKKNTKSETLKSPDLADSSSTLKKSAGAGKPVASQQKKTGTPNAKSLVSKSNGNSKSGGKTKVNSSALQSNSKSALAKAASSALMAKKSGSLAAGRLEALGETVCREVACEGLATSGGYCRLHYIKNWKKIKRKELILREKKLNQYIEELVAKYPDKYIEAIRQDLASDKDFAKVIYDLDLDEGVDDFDLEGGESVDSLIDTIKRDFDDEGDAF